MTLGYIGLGKMGLGMALKLQENGHKVVAFNRSEEGREAAKKAGLLVVDSIKEMMDTLGDEKIIWLMVSHDGVQAVLDSIDEYLKSGDIVIDGGNSRFTETIKREKILREKGVHYLDAGVSGGPDGARNGACIMIGGEKGIFKKIEKIFKDASAPNAYRYLGKSGAGHFVKMVHNGIEYGMMQAIGEGFEVMKRSDFNLDLEDVADLYQHKSVIESRLVGWLKEAYAEHTDELNGISGEVSHSGEGLWTVETAKEMNIPTPIIEESLQFRVKSQGNPSYTGKVVSALRNQFGGHNVSEK